VGLFTTLRVREGEVLFWPDHVARLKGGGPLDAEALLEKVAAAVKGMPDARVRITLRPPSPPLIEAQPYLPPSRPWRLSPVVVSHAGDAPLLKTTDRRRYDEARRAAGTADDALLVGPDGAVLETTIANVFFMFPGGEIVTPPTTGILPGIARGTLLGKATEVRLDLAAVAGATACVVTNALLLAHPVERIEGVRDFDSAALARDLRDAMDRTAPHLRIIQR
jgi:branched-subunit amino acid aminotransferase/4-amino-4-deoxychorismate lyase